MPVESVYPRLEPLAPAVQKPIQYVGGELNSTVKDWDAADVRWALMYPDAYEVGLPNQGVQILYEVLNEQRRRARRAHLQRVAGPRSADARARHAAVHRRRAPAGRRLRPARASASPPSSATRTCSPRSTWPASRCSATATAPTHLTRSSSPAATPRSTPSRSPTSSTPRCSATASRPCWPSPTSVRAWKAGGPPGGRDGLLRARWPPGRLYVPRFYDVDYLPDGRIAASTPNRRGVPRRSWPSTP